jgi:hypothetical protein
MGRKSVLAFLLDFEKRVEGPFKFGEIDREYDNLPTGRGAYIVRASGRTVWPYPWGKSPVFYVGKAANLRDRLWDHWDAARQHKKDYHPGWSPVHIYEAAYASEYYVLPTWQGMTPDALEKELFGRFGRWYGARPVANSQTRWERV